MENADELRMALLLDCAEDVTGWLYNHRSGYTLKRWRVAKINPAGEVEAITLVPDNPSFDPLQLTPGSGDFRVVPSRAAGPPSRAGP
jgi:hypothetical protein